MSVQKDIIKFGMKLFFHKMVISGIPAIIKNSKGEILLGKRDANMICYPNFWGLPGGVIEFEETFEQAIKRELQEELGVKCKVIKYGKADMNLPTKECPLQSISIPAYCKIKGRPRPKSETSEVKWFKPNKIKKMSLAYNHKKILEQEGII